MTVERNEAHIRVGNTVLTEAQSMAVRVALSSFRMECSDDDEMRDGIGHDLADAYKARLGEVLLLIARDAT